MSSRIDQSALDAVHPGLAPSYAAVRQQTASLCETLTPEDTVVQSMPDVSPTKWHLAHTTWYFERFVLRDHLPGYEQFNPAFDHLFNSYYYTVGQMFARPRRGLLSRPTLADVMRYRQYVDEQMMTLLSHDVASSEIEHLITLGLHHEQQHQELLLTDIKHVFSINPLQPVFREPAPRPATLAGELSFVPRPHGIVACGAPAGGPPAAGTGEATTDEARPFTFDNETPRHDVLVRPHALASRPVTNGEYLDFIRDGAYQNVSLWLADAWTKINDQGWTRPLYWSEDLTSEFTLNGLADLDPHAPVVHVSLYEADAFARWAGARLPSEFELELALEESTIDGNFVDDAQFHPRANDNTGLRQLFGDVWEWTASPYTPYPGFEPLAGSLGEYNGKFMCSQLVLRGGSCATPRSHIRPTYRNFFYPDARWQFSGIRLARDV
jgi:ergothioneine biosynthesis protein EgtB